MSRSREDTPRDGDDSCPSCGCRYAPEVERKTALRRTWSVRICEHCGRRFRTNLGRTAPESAEATGGDA